MSELIDRIPGRESATAALRSLRTATEQMKSRQRITGRSGQLGYKVESGSDWDIVITPAAPAPPAYAGIVFKVTYKGDGTQKFPLAAITTDIRFNGTGESNKPSATPGNIYTYSDANCDVIMGDFEFQEPSSFDSEFNYVWTFAMNYRGNVTIRMKPRIFASSPGTITVERVG